MDNEEDENDKSPMNQLFDMPTGAETPSEDLPDENSADGESIVSDESAGDERPAGSDDTEEAPHQDAGLALAQQLANQNQQLMQQQQQANQPQQPQMSQEQIDEALGVYNPTEDLINQMFGDGATTETRMAAMQELVNRTAQHAIKTAGYTQQFAARDMRAEFQPALQAARRQTQDTFTGNVEKAYPGFVGKRAAVDQVIAQMQQEGWVPKGPQNNYAEEAGIEVATRVTNLVRMIDPDFNPTIAGTAPAQRQSTSPRQPKMVEMGGGGQGGGGQPSSSSESNNIPAWKQALA
tara:strand:- start:6183 stop:7061 length:879 start_codon:yes stop_codon:yes gene_type:complete